MEDRFYIKIYLADDFFGFFTNDSEFPRIIEEKGVVDTHYHRSELPAMISLIFSEWFNIQKIEIIRGWADG